jgi:hypothetical protein
MRLPAGWTALRAATEYLDWLPRFLNGFLRVELESPEQISFVLWPFRASLLQLSRASDRSGSDRQLLYVTGGLLSREGGKPGKPRFELRQVLGGDTLLTVVHDYEPRLPWLIYVSTQAIFHRWLMFRFAAHLRRYAAVGKPAVDSQKALPS